MLPAAALALKSCAHSSMERGSFLGRRCCCWWWGPPPPSSAAAAAAAPASPASSHPCSWPHTPSTSARSTASSTAPSWRLPALSTASRSAALSSRQACSTLLWLW